MADIYDYLRWRGDLPAELYPLNEVDVMILAKLSYMPFDKISLNADSAPISVRNAADLLLAIPDIEQHIHWKDDADFLRALAESDRFCNMTLRGYVNKIEEENQTQFSAITVQIGDKLSCVSFKGTDYTLVGWKENFNMSFICPVPAQESAAQYLKNAAENLDGSFIVCGHSKGGNLAMYAASFCREDIRERIDSVYNFDGPGFSEKVLNSEGYRHIRDKMITFIPQSSIVGLLLGHDERYIVVKSSEKAGLLQHDISSWEVERDHFSYIDNITDSSKFLDRTLKGWIADMDEVQREEFIDAIYSIVAQTNVRSIREMDDKRLECALAILSSFGSLDEKTRKLIFDSLSLLAKNAKKSMGKNM